MQNCPSPNESIMQNGPPARDNDMQPLWGPSDENDREAHWEPTLDNGTEPHWDNQSFSLHALRQLQPQTVRLVDENVLRALKDHPHTKKSTKGCIVAFCARKVAGWVVTQEYTLCAQCIRDYAFDPKLQCDKTVSARSKIDWKAYAHLEMAMIPPAPKKPSPTAVHVSPLMPPHVATAAPPPLLQPAPPLLQPAPPPHAPAPTGIERTMGIATTVEFLNTINLDIIEKQKKNPKPR